VLSLVKSSAQLHTYKLTVSYKYQNSVIITHATHQNLKIDKTTKNSKTLTFNPTHVKIPTNHGSYNAPNHSLTWLDATKLLYLCPTTEM